MKPLRADAVRNRQKILETAEHMFAKHGLGVSVDDIADEANIGIGTLYRHFPTKQALIAALAGAHFEQFADRAEQLARSPQPMAALRELIELMVTESADKRDLLEALGGSKWTSGPEIEPLRARYRRALSNLFANAQRAGEVCDDVSFADLSGLIRVLFRSELDARTRIRLVRILFDGLRPRARSEARP
jgi:AcrR family transcriptional regulator